MAAPELHELNTDKVTGKVTVADKDMGLIDPQKPNTWSRQYEVAMENGYYVIGKDGFAYGLKTSGDKRILQRLTGPDGKDLQFDMKAKDAFGEIDHRAGQVIEPKTKKAVVGDYDLQDVIHPSHQSTNISIAPEKVGGDVYGPFVRKVKKLFNQMVRSSGDPFDRIVHGADAQFMQFRQVGRDKAYKGDAIAVLPDGRVAYFNQDDLAKFYNDIGRSRLDIKDAELTKYKKGDEPGGPPPSPKPKPGLRLVASDGKLVGEP